MPRLLRWFALHRRLTTTLIVAYLAVNVLSHDLVQVVAQWIQDRLTVRWTNSLVTILGCATLAVCAIFVPFKLKTAPQKRLILFYCAATTVLVAITYQTLFMVNTESVHFPQYALLAFPVLALVRRFGETVLLVTIMGAVDESYQYWVLSRAFPLYLDFNDMILNLEGAAIGVMLFLILTARNALENRPPAYSLFRLFTSPAAITAGAALTVALVLRMLGHIALYPESDAWIVLRRIGPPTAFWINTYWGKTCHVLMPLEGMLLIGCMTAFYVLLDFRIRIAPTAR